jgi:hypothetical protein
MTQSKCSRNNPGILLILTVILSLMIVIPACEEPSEFPRGWSEIDHVPSDWPTDIPLPDSLRILAYSYQEENRYTNAEIQVAAGGEISIEALTEYYVDSLPGWEFADQWQEGPDLPIMLYFIDLSNRERSLTVEFYVIRENDGEFHCTLTPGDTRVTLFYSE